MARNIKVDVIYYSTAKDFEFEFNLCSACQIRLLSDCTNTLELLPHSLARAFSRSQVVIVTGLYSDELISNVAQSIGFSTAEINYDEYNIATPYASLFINGAVPLVTTSGKYIGLILESGPQTLVLISSKKNSRKEIMSSLIQPYIADLSRMPHLPSQPTNEEPIKVEEITPELEETITLPEDTNIEESQNIVDVFSDTELLSQNENIAEPVSFESEEEDIEETDLSSNIYARIDSESFEAYRDHEYEEDAYDDQNKAFVIPFQINENVSEDYYSDYEETFVDVPKKKGLPIATIVLLIVLLILVSFIAYCLIIEPIIKGISLNENLQQIFGFLLN